MIYSLVFGFPFMINIVFFQKLQDGFLNVFDQNFKARMVFNGFLAL